MVKEILQVELEECDFLEMGSGVDGARSVVEFAETGPVSGNVKVILVNDADRLSDSAQDALLKLSESPPEFLVIILIAYDVGFLQPALASRVRSEFKFFPFSFEEMNEYASKQTFGVSEKAIIISSGLPELYDIIASNHEFDELYNQITLAAERKLSILSKPPKIISELDSGDNRNRDVILHVIRHACRRFFHDSLVSIPILKFCSVLSDSKSANAEIHWMRMVSDISV